MTCTTCLGPLPRYPETGRDQAGAAWLFCGWRCLIEWRAGQGEELALRIVSAMGWESWNLKSSDQKQTPAAS